jgi:hypothetical protein
LQSVGMDPLKVDLVIKYALARAAHEDTTWARELGPIHLLKYVYLADLAHAQAHGGESFTGTEWRFYHYGPWSPAVMDRIDDVVAAVHAQKSVYESTKYDNDRVRWFVEPEDADDLQHEAERELPSVVISAVRAAVHKFGSDTSTLLHHVYSTPPMLHAAPNEVLDFATAKPHERPPRAAPAQPLTRKQEKKRESALLDLRKRTQEKLAALRAERAGSGTARAPRYDEVFTEGQKWLDDVEGGGTPDFEGEVEFDDEIWKSPWRSDSGH